MLIWILVRSFVPESRVCKDNYANYNTHFSLVGFQDQSTPRCVPLLVLLVEGADVTMIAVQAASGLALGFQVVPSVQIVYRDIQHPI